MVYFIPTPIGNLDDISVRSLKLLAECKTLFCEDTRITKRLLSLLKERHNLHVNVERFISMHSHNEKHVLSSLDVNIFNENVGYLSDAGMPGISDPGSALVRFCQEKKIAYEILNLDGKNNKENEFQTWEQMYFYNTPISVTLQNLNQIKLLLYVLSN